MTSYLARFSGWPLWCRAGALAVAGAAGALAHAPFDFAPFIIVPLIGVILAYHTADRIRAAIVSGLALGFGYFGATLAWIIEPFQVDAATTGWMAPIAAVLLALLLGSFWALALGTVRWLGQLWALIPTFSAAEFLRAYVFTGFPWASPPQALVDGLVGQGLAFVGPHGMMVLMMSVTVLAFYFQKRVATGICLVAHALVTLVPTLAAPSAEKDVTIRLLQPNAPQDEKWDPQRIPVFIDRQLDFVAAEPAPDLILMPETALPYLLKDAEPVLDGFSQTARGTPIILGIQRQVAGRYYNSLVFLDRAGAVAAVYDKHHLVPFGEYMPFQWLFQQIDAGGLAARVDRGYTPGDGPSLLDLGPLGRVLPLICYEVVFAHNLAVGTDRPDFLVNLTNDAWFGSWSGPQQHLAQARMRAIEQGLPMLRSANTGISAVIDPYGRVLDALPLNEAGYLDVALPVPRATTLYAQTGDLPWALLVAGLLAVAWIRRKRPIDATPKDA